MLSGRAAKQQWSQVAATALEGLTKTCTFISTPAWTMFRWKTLYSSKKVFWKDTEKYADLLLLMLRRTTCKQNQLTEQGRQKTEDAYAACGKSKGCVPFLGNLPAASPNLSLTHQT